MRHTIILIAVYATLFVTNGRASSPDWAAVHSLTINGIQRLYNLDIDEAEQMFDSVSRIAPTDPRGPFFQSIVHFYLYTLNRDEKELNTFLDESEHVIDICEAILDKNPDDGTTKFYLGGIHGYRGMAYQTSGSYLKAAQNGRRGYNLLEEAVRDNPKLYDAQMGFGLFRYMIAKIPKSLRWLVSILGFEGDLEGGLASIRVAAEKGTYTRTEAKLYLAQFMFSEGRRDTALRYLGELRKEFPENTLFVVLYAFWQHRMDNYTEALSAAHSAVELNKRKKIRYGEELAYSTLGSIYYTLNDFANASAYYKLYMKMTRNDERTPNYSFYRAAVAVEITGDRQTALEYCRRMKEPDSKSSAWESQNYRRGQELLRQPLTEADIFFIKAGNEQAQKDYASAIEAFEHAAQIAGNDSDVLARALYGKQQAQFSADKYADAVETSQKLLTLKPQKETWLIPHGWFKLGQTYARLARPADARKAFEKVRDFDNYESQERLEGQTDDELRKLDK
jgi:tetratricopeptide (TPR) repeat protein